MSNARTAIIIAVALTACALVASVWVVRDLHRLPTDVFIVPHADDEAISMPEALAASHAAGHHTIVVFTTASEYGPGSPGELWQAERPEYGRERRAQSIRVCRALGADEVLVIGEPSNSDVMPVVAWKMLVRLSASRVVQRADTMWVTSPTGNKDHRASWAASVVAYALTPRVKRLVTCWGYTVERGAMRPISEPPHGLEITPSPSPARARALDSYAEWFNEHYPDRYLPILHRAKSVQGAYSLHALRPAPLPILVPVP